MTTAAGGRGRAGYTGLPNALFATVGCGDLTIAQFGVAGLIAHDMNFARSVVEIDGHRIDVDVGELLFSTRTFAKRHRLKRDAVLRAVKRLCALAWIERRNAWEPAPPPAPSSAPPPAPGVAPPPTVIRWLRDRCLLWPSKEAAPPPAPEDAPPAAPIQHGTLNPQHVSSSDSSSASCAALTRDAAPQEDSSKKQETTADRTILANEVKRLRVELAARLGVRKVSVATKQNRERVASEMADWITREGYAYVLEACVHRAYREALERLAKPPDSLAWYVEARDDVSDALPAGARAAPPSLDGIRFNPTSGNRVPRDDGYWMPLLTRMTPLQVRKWRYEAETNEALQDPDDAARRRAWNEFEDRWRQRVGLKVRKAA